MTISEDGPKCRCGNRGCLEAYVGSYGLVRSARELLKQKSGRVLRRYLEEEKHKLTPRLILEAARLGDAVATKVVRNAGEHLGVGIASLINIFNPGVVVIGGGVSGAFDLLQPHVERTIRKRAYAESARMTRIVRSSLGNDATVVGAALMAKDTFPAQP
jgi:predicted NBD/HSP70 family sugar kinase